MTTEANGPNINENQNSYSNPTHSDENNHGRSLTLSFLSKNYLLETAKWAKFLSILGFVLTGLVVLMGLFMSSILSFAGSMVPQSSLDGTPNPLNMMSGFFGVVYILIAAVYFFPVYYLYNFSSKIISGIQVNSEVLLENAFKNLKSHYKFVGIIALIFTIMYGGIFLIGLIGMALGLSFM